MSVTALDHDLQVFAIELFERSGGVADWPVPEIPGSVVTPLEVATAAQLPGEEFSLGLTAAPETLQVGLGGEFLDVAARVLSAAVPRDGSFCISERYLTSRDLTDRIVHTFGWQNARAKWREAEPATVEYHRWTLLGSLRSEDVWEAMFRFGVNTESQAIIELPDVFQEPDILGEDPARAPDEPTTFATAIAEGKRRLIMTSAEFVRRIEQRLERDRKRLQDYYRALSREANGSKRRAAAAPSPEEIAAKKRAVDLELRRKLAEMNESYALRAELRPVVLARVRLPALVVPVVIQRKQAVREYRLYWNSLLKKLEPLSCSRCRRATFSATFTNETVDLLCAACAERT
ncbi:MAG TPA: hypothetical protein VGY55_25555 [Pirellulales bacterium]|jgi:hypothetical protein|nr:hypothetical protein [Pirellulales bacterium]